MKDYSNYLGAKFFIKTDDFLVVKRVISFVNESTARIKDEETKEVSKISWDELFENYTLLNPDGYVFFNVITLNKDKKDEFNDVIIYLYRQTDIENHNEPWVVCRQCFMDILGNMISTSQFDYHIGCCMSVESCPVTFDYKLLRACDDVEYGTTVACYNNDKLSDILSCIRKIDVYDKVLKESFELNASKVTVPELLKTVKNLSKEEMIEMRGFCKTLEDLLVKNEFMYEYRRGFGIADINYIDIKEAIIDETDFNGLVLNDETMQIIQHEFNVTMYDPYIMKYDKDIVLEDIPREKVLVCDKNEDIYVISYESK